MIPLKVKFAYLLAVFCIYFRFCITPEMQPQSHAFRDHLKSIEDHNVTILNDVPLTLRYRCVRKKLLLMESNPILTDIAETTKSVREVPPNSSVQNPISPYNMNAWEMRTKLVVLMEK